MASVHYPNNPPAALFRRKKEQKRGITFSVLLVGSSGTGKTTFANNLLDSTIFEHRFQPDIPRYENPMVKLINPTKVVTFNSKSGFPSSMTPFDPVSAHLEPGITLTSTSVEITTDSTSDDPRDKMCFNLTDTHGLGDNLDNEICFDEIVAYLEQQFDLVLAEETRVKRNPRFEDGRVHAALYFIEPTGHGLRELDIEIMKRLSRYTNVLPIICRADSFTAEELQVFKKNILEDIEYYNVPVYKFEVDEDEEDVETIEEIKNLASLQPFAVVCSDVKNASGKYVRSYPWGDVLVDDMGVSDLRVLKNVLFGTHLQEFKDTTHNLLYENYRAEKLSSISEWEDPRRASKHNNSAGRYSSTPSLSNFASLVNSGNFTSQQSLNSIPNMDNPPLTPNMDPEAVNKDEESPLRKLSVTIRRENEEIIKNIKNSPKSADSTSRDKSKLRNISETLPYVLRHERIILKQQKLEELEAQSTRELQKRIHELEKKAMELKLKEKLLKQRNSSTSSNNPSNDSRVTSEQTNGTEEPAATTIANTNATNGTDGANGANGANGTNTTNTTNATNAANATNATNSVSNSAELTVSGLPSALPTSSTHVAADSGTAINPVNNTDN
ncbi:HBR288Wp [Eremothecium sinecaudum]|uniref:HBR288Wp n=1 Tax=Eremothecium sinecaudum TaxID=45286 RepID=A0A120K1A4_9SACH|nr:HBR288Wp [Eremothecium sinecaudum]AMD19189.1 HBR288Wp [Eremothecium sinecaudum]